MFWLKYCVCQDDEKNEENVSKEFFESPLRLKCIEYLKSHKDISDQKYLYFDLSLEIPLIYDTESAAKINSKDVSIIYKVGNLRNMI